MGILRLGPFNPPSGWVARFSDDFNRADGALGSNYEFFGDPAALGSADLEIVGNQVKMYGEANINRRARYRVTTAAYSFSADQAARFTYTGPPDAGISNEYHIGCGLRGSEAAGLYYGIHLHVDPNTGTGFKLYRQNGTGTIQLVTTGTAVPNTGDEVFFTIIGNAVQVYVNDVLDIDVTDITGGVGAPSTGQPFLSALGSVLNSGDTTATMDDVIFYEWMG